VFDVGAHERAHTHAGFQMSFSDFEAEYVAPARIVTEATAAELLGVSAATLRRMASRNQSPPRLRISPRRVGYRLSDIKKWLSEQAYPPQAAWQRK
jgi:predicted DNA-binding transcriptional regulator AlpA